MFHHVVTGGLHQLQDAGVHAMKVQKIAKWGGGLVATGAGVGTGAELAGLLGP